MKKTLALILALLMILSITLVSCGDKEKQSQSSSTDDIWNYGGDENNDNSGEEGENNQNGGNQTSTNTYEEINQTMYVLHPVKVRGIDKKTTQNTVGTLDFGDSVTVTGKNSTWYRVKLANGTIGYVYDDVLTSSADAVTVKLLDTPIEVEIYNLGKNDKGEAISLNVRSTPWNCSASACDVADYVNINVLANISNKKYTVTDGFKVIKLGATADGNWIRIKYTAKVDGVDVTEWGFCHKDYIKTQGESAPVDPNTPPTIAPIL